MWTCTTSRTRRPRPPRLAAELGTGREGGFSLIEVVLGLTLALCLALGLAPVWVSFQALARDEGDRTVWAVQVRVAVARFERDLRQAGAGSCPFPSSGAVLYADETQVIFLSRAAGTGAPRVVEWELVNGALMRRWGPCPAVRPLSFRHSLYVDNKTMLEGVDTARSAFSYFLAGREADSGYGQEVALVDSILLSIAERASEADHGPAMTAHAAVGR